MDKTPRAGLSREVMGGKVLAITDQLADGSLEVDDLMDKVIETLEETNLAAGHALRLTPQRAEIVLLEGLLVDAFLNDFVSTSTVGGEVFLYDPKDSRFASFPELIQGESPFSRLKDVLYHSLHVALSRFVAKLKSGEADSALLNQAFERYRLVSNSGNLSYIKSALDAPAVNIPGILELVPVLTSGVVKPDAGDFAEIARSSFSLLRALTSLSTREFGEATIPIKGTDRTILNPEAFIYRPKIRAVCPYSGAVIAAGLGSIKFSQDIQERIKDVARKSTDVVVRCPSIYPVKGAVPLQVFYEFVLKAVEKHIYPLYI